MRRLLVIGSLVAGVLGTQALPAQAATPAVTCGAHVTTDVVLRHDLACPGDGLFIDADDVTVDLHGHTLAGSGTGAGVSAGDPLAPLDALRHGITVRRGTISGFTTGVSFVRVRDSRLERLQITGNHSSATTRGMGASFFDSNSNIAVDRSVIDDNEVGVAMILFTRGVTLNHTRVSHNTGGGVVGTLSGGLTVAASQFTDNEGPAISMSDLGDVHVRSTLVRGNGSGIDSNGGNDVIERNVIVDNDGPGISLGGFDTTNERVVGNVVTGNTMGLFLQPILSPDRPNTYTVERNTFVRNAEGGVVVEVIYPSRPANATGTVAGNLLVANGSDGLLVSLDRPAPWLTVARNLAVANTELGINVPGANDGGGNRASANGNPAQCVGVSC